MLELVFLLCFICITILVIKYLKSLDFLLEIDSSWQELQKVTMFQQSCSSKLYLMKDIKFYFCILSGSYKVVVFSPQMVDALDNSRRYLVLQYPFMIVMFLIPIWVKLYGLTSISWWNIF